MARAKVMNPQTNSSAPLGHKRSLIRRIGSNLPLPSTQRARFELLPSGARLIETENKPVFSFSDISQIVDVPLKKVVSAPAFGGSYLKENEPTKVKSSTTTEGLDTALQNPTTGKDRNDADDDKRPDEMVHKIKNLEDELSALRSQIAMLVSNQNRLPPIADQSFNTSVVSATGDMASTPVKNLFPSLTH